MAISTHSKIYYGLKINTNTRYIDFKEGLVIYKATLNVGSYSGAKLATEIKKQLDAVGAYTYTVTFNRTTRKFTIAGSSTFSLLSSSGVNSANSAFLVIGFNTNTDKTLGTTYTGETTAGSEYKTQFYIQSFKPTSQNKKAIDGVINESSNGAVEVVKFGNKRFLSGEFNFITNIIQGYGSKIRNNPTGVDDFIKLMEWLTEKYVFEFMVDENKPEIFETFILESTEQDSKGLDYELIELYDKSLPEYFRSGALKFRLME